jgi:hypothetical protein
MGSNLNPNGNLSFWHINVIARFKVWCGKTSKQLRSSNNILHNMFWMKINKGLLDKLNKMVMALHFWSI